MALVLVLLVLVDGDSAARLRPCANRSLTTSYVKTRPVCQK